MTDQQNAVSRAYHDFKNAAESLPKAETQQDFIRCVGEAHRCLLDIVKHYKPGVEQCDDTLGMTDEEYKVMRGRWLAKMIPFPWLSPDFLSLPTAAEICSAEKISGATILDSLNRFDASKADSPCPFLVLHFKETYAESLCLTQNLTPLKAGGYRYVTFCGNRGDAMDSAFYPETDTQKVTCPKCAEIHNQTIDLDTSGCSS